MRGPPRLDGGARMSAGPNSLLLIFPRLDGGARTSAGPHSLLLIFPRLDGGARVSADSSIQIHDSPQNVDVRLSVSPSPAPSDQNPGISFPTTPLPLIDHSPSRITK